MVTRQGDPINRKRVGRRRDCATYHRHQAEIVPRLERLKTMSSDAYRLGRLSLLESLDAEQARTEVALDNIESTTALVEAQVRYLSATGRLLNFIESK